MARFYSMLHSIDASNVTNPFIPQFHVATCLWCNTPYGSVRSLEGGPGSIVRCIPLMHPSQTLTNLFQMFHSSMLQHIPRKVGKCARFYCMLHPIDASNVANPFVQQCHVATCLCCNTPYRSAGSLESGPGSIVRYILLMMHQTLANPFISSL